MFKPPACGTWLWQPQGRIRLSLPWALGNVDSVGCQLGLCKNRVLSSSLEITGLSKATWIYSLNVRRMPRTMLAGALDLWEGTGSFQIYLNMRPFHGEAAVRFVFCVEHTVPYSGNLRSKNRSVWRAPPFVPSSSLPTC